MPIRFSQEHLQSAGVVQNALSAFARGTNPPELAGIPFDSLRLESPHLVYDLRADEIVNGAGLESAHLTGVRYLVYAAGKLVAAAEAQLDANNASPVLANLNYGPFVAATADAFESLPRLAPAASGQYEARLLRFSAIYVIAIWLKSLDGGADAIYQVAPAPPELRSRQFYTAADFIETIRPLARKRIEKQDPKMVP